MSNRRPLFTLLALSLAVAGCSTWDLGPEPDNSVGKGGNPQLPTDANLQAVTPHVPGDDPGGAAILPDMPATNPSTSPAATQVSNPATAPIADSLSVQEAILTGLEHNIELRVQRYSVPITRTAEETALSAFDPKVTGQLSGGRTVTGKQAPSAQPVNPNPIRGVAQDSINGSIDVTEFLPTGTTIDGKMSTSDRFYTDRNFSNDSSITVTQSLLRGAGLDVNLATLRKAEVSTKISQFQLRDTAESLVSNIELSYWDLAYAERQVVIVRNALDVAQKQLDDTRTRVNVDRLAPSELPAAEAEVASRREDIINADSNLETTRLKFLQFLAPANREFWSHNVNLTTLPFIPPGVMDPADDHVNVALKLRPDMNEAKLRIQQGDLDIVRTKNGLLPQLDFFVTLDKSGNSGAHSSFGDSLPNVFDNTNYSVVAGVKGDWEPINRAARASYRSAQLTKDQLQDTLDNQAQQVQLEVRTQYIEVTRTRQQIDATRATREARQADFAVQQGRLAAGNGTSLLVSIAQRDLLSAQLAEVQSVTNHLKALVSLYSLEGTLLLRRGIHAPGEKPIDSIAWH